MNKSYTLILEGTGAQSEFLLSNEQRSSFHSVLPSNMPPNTMFVVEYEFVSRPRSMTLTTANIQANNIPELVPVVWLCSLCQFGHLQANGDTQRGALAVTTPTISYLHSTATIVYLQLSHKAQGKFITNNVWNMDRIVIQNANGANVAGWHKFTFTPML